ncbi:hypothetical protein B0H14DRAFT_3423850 [Mycena olivaceomarginata]|nr:hypothetical protein B0H14DRAFT_3423850 [Mycena olivaceomarginata]
MKHGFAVYLETKRDAISVADDTCKLRNAITAGLAKLKIHTDKVLISDYSPTWRRSPSGNSPGSPSWNEDLVCRAKTTLEHLHGVYKEELDEISPAMSKKPASTLQLLWLHSRHSGIAYHVSVDHT